MKKNYFITYLLLLGAVCLLPLQLNAQKATQPAPVKASDFAEVIARGDYEEGVLVVKMKPGYEEEEIFESSTWMQIVGKHQVAPHKHFYNLHNFNKLKLKVKPVVDLSLFYELRIDTSIDLLAVIDNLIKSGLVEYAQPSIIYHSQYVPNDPLASRQYYLETVKAYEAWDISKGDTSIVIGIVDSGYDFNHPDFEGQFAYNYDDPINGIDDDGDGYVDNFMGWDFVGADARNPAGNNNPQLPAGASQHGIQVAGCSNAAVDNGIGIAGVGFNCRVLATKHSSDQGTRDGIIRGYQGLLYMAEQGADVINASWGGYGRDPSLQDIINLIVFNYDAVIVTSAGNDATNRNSYPGSFNYLLCVGSTTRNDVVSSFSNYGDYVDIMAPGSGIFTTEHSEGAMYGNTQGTSFSSPITAGAAGLVRSHFPELSALKVIEQLKATADDITNINPNFRGQIGSGRLNVYRALTETPPSIYMTDQTFRVGDRANILFAGDEVEMSGRFENRLWNSNSDLKARISTRESGLTFIDSEILLGVIRTDESVRPRESFKFKVNETVGGTNRTIRVRIDYEQEGFASHEFFTLLINPDYTVIDANQITTSVDNEGTIGRHQEGTQGMGVFYKGDNLLANMGFMAGNSARQLVSATPGTENSFRTDFSVVRAMRSIDDFNPNIPFRIWEATFNDAAAPANRRNNIEVRQRIIARPSSQSNDKFIIVEYDILNRGASELSNFHAGLFADWDVPEWNRNRLGWDESRQLGFAYNENADTYAGLRALGAASAHHTAIAYDANYPGTPFGLSNGFTDAEKFDALIGRQNVTQIATGDDDEPTDVSHVMGQRIPLQPNASQTIAFAIVVGDTQNEIAEAADLAQQTYELYRAQEINATEEERGLEAAIKLFPNPHKGAFSLQLPDEMLQQGVLEISIINSLGQLLESRSYKPARLTDNRLQIDMPLGAAKGLYFVRISNGRTSVSKSMICE
ncbi:MAG: S8 family peptidase [Bernardetiaceae bacterium]|nr:S8 family peptidase [Bernardetiaceae bacterium]